MIKNFANGIAQDIYDGLSSRHAGKLPLHLRDKARRLLDQLNAATNIETLRRPPSNKLVKSSGNMKNFWRPKIGKQWAIVFKWNQGHASSVRIIDHH